MEAAGRVCLQDRGCETGISESGPTLARVALWEVGWRPSNPATRKIPVENLLVTLGGTGVVPRSLPVREGAPADNVPPEPPSDNLGDFSELNHASRGHAVKALAPRDHCSPVASPTCGTMSREGAENASRNDVGRPTAIPDHAP
jgi:hypothetical protein